ncbi:MAG: DJ-1/PfpI family protein [Euryarchaeota archaeon]|nr:DJ-1/PfpI family protein [Euryarchaeota archaeon]
MTRALVILAEGFEEIEATTIIDVLRRGGVEVTAAGLAPGPARGSHGISLLPDTTLDQTRGTYDAIVLPGGSPGTENLARDPRVLDLLRQHHQAQKTVAAVCAAPSVLARAGLLQGRRATIYPTMTDHLQGAHAESQAVVQDGNLVTSQGPGTTMAFALALLERLAGRARADEVGQRLLYRP